MESYQGEAQIIDLHDFEFVVYYLDEIPQSYTLESEIFLNANYISIKRKG